MLHPLVIPDVPDLGDQVWFRSREIQGEQAEVIVHDGTFNPVFVRRGEFPALVEPAGGDIVEWVAIRVLEFGNFRVVNVPADEEKVVCL
jgi:hypothetical protein